PRDNPALPPFQPPSDLLHRPVPAGPAAAVLLLGTFPVPADAPEPPDVSELLEAGLHHLAAGPDPEPVRKLYAVWLARRRTAAADRPDRVLSVWSVGSSCPCC
ncbi:MAG: hypothetical protein K2X87_12825, partial [Gemmataceae bacterium]|nr:hypothetical protein [Gemmataceae bacterium]